MEGSDIYIRTHTRKSWQISEAQRSQNSTSIDRSPQVYVLGGRNDEHILHCEILRWDRKGSELEVVLVNNSH